jgi:hypothetical protein
MHQMKRMFMAAEKDKGGGGSGEVTALPNRAGEQQRSDDDRFFLLKLTDKGGEWAKNNPVKTTLGAAIIGPVIASRVVAPAYDWAKDGVTGLFKKKVADKVATEAKNAMSIGDALGFVASSIGSLVK